MKAAVLLATMVAVVMAKNVVQLEPFDEKASAAAIDKRSPKNSINFDRLELSLNQLIQRDDANSELASEVQEVVLLIYKRKNVVDIDTLKTYLEKENAVSGSKVKRSDADIQTFLELISSCSDDDSTKFKADLDQLHTAMSSETDISYFAFYVRAEPNVAAAIEQDKILMVVASTNDALATKLDGKKPWEFPLPVDGSESDDANADANISNFVLLSVILLTPEEIERAFKSADSQVKVKSFNGKEYTISNENGVDYVAGFPVVKTIEFEDGLVLVINDCLVKP